MFLCLDRGLASPPHSYYRLIVGECMQYAVYGRPERCGRGDNYCNTRPPACKYLIANQNHSSRLITIPSHGTANPEPGENLSKGGQNAEGSEAFLFGK